METFRFTAKETEAWRDEMTSVGWSMSQEGLGRNILLQTVSLGLFHLAKPEVTPSLTSMKLACDPLEA